MTEQYAIWTRYKHPKGKIIRHVFGPYPTRSKAQTDLKHMLARNLDYGNDMSRVEVQVTKMVDVKDEDNG